MTKSARLPFQPGQSVKITDAASAYCGRVASVRCLYQVGRVVVLTVEIANDAGKIVFAVAADKAVAA